MIYLPWKPECIMITPLEEFGRTPEGSENKSAVELIVDLEISASVANNAIEAMLNA